MDYLIPDNLGTTEIFGQIAVASDDARYLMNLIKNTPSKTCREQWQKDLEKTEAYIDRCNAIILQRKQELG